MTNNLQERKFSFIFGISILLVSLTILLLTNDTIDLFPYLSLSYLRRSSLSDLSTTASPSNPRPSPSPATVASPTYDSSLNESPVNRAQDGKDGDQGTDEPPTNDSLLNESPVTQSLDDFDGRGKDELGNGMIVGWRRCESTDYIPCLDNTKAIKRLKSRRHMEHRERHCPSPPPKCLVPLPKHYKIPLPWPQSRDMIWYDNVPHPKLVEYKKDQNWVRKSGSFFVFPGGGTQFKDGVIHYINFIQKTLPVLEWGKNVRVALDVGCGVASFGGTLLEKDVITMSFAPKDEHEAQIQFALERGIPATLAVIGTQMLPFPGNSFDVIQCARCRVHWHGYGGRPLLELNRILRPGGFFVWSATPIYKNDEKHLDVWQTMESLTKSICWKVVAKTRFSSVGFVVYQKPESDYCYQNRKENNPPLCTEEETMKNSSWYTPLISCLPRTQTGVQMQWPLPWPARLTEPPVSLSEDPNKKEIFRQDTRRWSEIVSEFYIDNSSINWTRIRNVMDMNAGYGGFGAALMDRPVWVMNVVPIEGEDTLSIIYDRGMIGMYHDWCESFNTYPRSYDLLHSSFLLSNLSQRCDLVDVAVELDRVLRPGGYLVVQDTIEMLQKLNPILLSLQWSTNLHKVNRFLFAQKTFWRP
ncbi:PREDICTED: probable methyltransferase PMT22 [Tarenaya hassleriana]|uniref:probable methyltransferase PMT22 n=1 Tax=Tarenaya hassleriana TaxID=28532 RepID=UPI00053C484D|nr:PREDICTED: probable methyltransferase PMT22 [Tarenaya hassleriana]